MSKRQKNYQDFLSVARRQSTGWLQRCAAEPSEGMNRVAIVRLALRTVLRERTGPAWHDVSHITDCGVTSRLQNAIRVF